MNKQQLLQNAKPILFNTDMVQAILDGRKTATRRVVKPQPKYQLKQKTNSLPHDWFEYSEHPYADYVSKSNWGLGIHSKYAVGDILYVRETWAIDEQMPYDNYIYRTDEIIPSSISKWKPSIHMPKEAARIFLRITGVRVERLQGITEEQAKAEGFINNVMRDNGSSASKKFSLLWNSTIKKQDIDQYGWNANPWIWVYEFERIEVDD